ncbi:adenylosuccinate lyase family protein [Lacibacterium aquatile]|uniref:Adenylosuccinate lyase family protein n=1 Tax=Lacibacterium aquatile TaxID=1168082 RepID=A0ABW5DV86_9PROT
MPLSMYDSYITSHWFSADAKAVWDDLATIQAWLDVEAALAQAQADVGLIPADAAVAITASADVSLLDLDKLAEDIAFAQHPFVPVLKQIESHCGDRAAGYLHWGATTQNIFDTGAALQMRKTHALILTALTQVETQVAALARQHSATVQPGRTHGQHALPTTFGYKALGWLEELRRSRQRLEDRIDGSFVACMGGAIGTFAAMNGQGRRVEALMAEKLGLRPAVVPLRSSFDRASDYISSLTILAGSAEKVAQDVVFLQRTELGELEESFHMGKVGSSTMAQKRNPSMSLTLISLCRMLRSRAALAVETMVRMDEGDSSTTNIADITLREVAIIAVSIVEMLAKLTAGLTVHADAMRRNLEISNGLIASEAVMMQLSDQLGRHHAHHMLYEAAQRSVAEGIPFLTLIRDSLTASGHPEIAESVTIDPAAYLGEVESLISDLTSPTA